MLLLDPMLATGGSAAHAVQVCKDLGARNVRLLCIIAAPEGVETLHDEHPDVVISRGVPRPPAQRHRLHPAGPRRRRRPALGHPLRRNPPDGVEHPGGPGVGCGAEADAERPRPTAVCDRLGGSTLRAPGAHRGGSRAPRRRRGRHRRRAPRRRRRRRRPRGLTPPRPRRPRAPQYAPSSRRRSSEMPKWWAISCTSTWRTASRRASGSSPAMRVIDRRYSVMRSGSAKT